MGKSSIRVSISPRGPTAIKNPATALLKTAKSKSGAAVKDNKKARQQCSQLQDLVDAVTMQRTSAKSAAAKIEVEKDKLIELIRLSIENDQLLKAEVEEAEAALAEELKTFVFVVDEKKTESSKKSSEATIKALKAKLAKLEKDENSDAEQKADSSDSSDGE